MLGRQTSISLYAFCFFKESKDTVFIFEVGEVGELVEE